MAEISNEELVSELSHFGEHVQLPIKPNKRPILIKKLNHFRARAKAQEASPSKAKSRQISKQSSFSVQKLDSPQASSFSNINNKQPSQSASIASAPKTSRSYGLNNLEAFSSDDSDVDLVPSASLPLSTGANHASSTSNTTSFRDKTRLSNVSDNVLRTLRRRTGELPPRRTRRSEVHELNDEEERYENVSNGTPEKSPVPSPARSRLYPNLNKFYPKANDDNFESSDSDLDGSTYLVTNKSVNTSFQSFKSLSDEDDEARSEPLEATSFNHKNVSKRNNSFNDTPSLYPRNVSTFSQRRFSTGPYRVQQYKSKYLENLPQILVAVVIIFFVGISLTYVVIHKDYFISWLSSPYQNDLQGKKLECLSQDRFYALIKNEGAFANVAELKTMISSSLLQPSYCYQCSSSTSSYQRENEQREVYVMVERIIAFGENSENNSSQIIYSPTPCLKIRNMFDSNVWRAVKAGRKVSQPLILEKCESIRHIVHVYIDVDSREGCVYLKCSSCEAAGQARQALSMGGGLMVSVGRWGGKQGTLLQWPDGARPVCYAALCEPVFLLLFVIA
ncbi:hypothetical protein Btru_061430 [Bulinus truncatus]|nr:hypothetical protein Btru_061430 [Bulinus truncatus]